MTMFRVPPGVALPAAGWAWGAPEPGAVPVVGLAVWLGPQATKRAAGADRIRARRNMRCGSPSLWCGHDACLRRAGDAALPCTPSDVAKGLARTLARPLALPG